MSAIGSFGFISGQGAQLTTSSAARSATATAANRQVAANTNSYCPTCNGGGASKTASANCPTCNGGVSSSARSSLPATTYSRTGTSSGSQLNAYCPTCNGGSSAVRGTTSSYAGTAASKQGGTLCVACQYNR